MRVPSYLLPLLFLVSCKAGGDDDAPARVVDDGTDESYLIGVSSDEFACESVLSLADATALFGGRVHRVESPHTPPAGVPPSCDYLSHAEGRPPVGYSFDLDCRDGALKDAGNLMVTHSDAPDATPMRIGSSALDHHDSALLFIDDDTPCYGRVLGLGRETRSATAKAIVKGLTPRSAPTGAQLVLKD